MIMFNMFAKALPEDTRRVIIYIFLIFVLVFILAGAIGALVKRIMVEQGKQADGMLFDVVEAGVITDERKLRRFGFKKNQRKFLKEAWIPFLIMLASVLILFIFYTANHCWAVNPFGKDQFGTIFYQYDWEGAKGDFFGMHIVTRWPDVISKPHLSADAWGSYIFVPGFIVGAVWYLICVQAYIARDIKIYKISKKVFNKNFDNFDPNKGPVAPINPENPEDNR